MSLLVFGVGFSLLSARRAALTISHVQCHQRLGRGLSECRLDHLLIRVRLSHLPHQLLLTSNLAAEQLIPRRFQQRSSPSTPADPTIPMTTPRKASTPPQVRSSIEGPVRKRKFADVPPLKSTTVRPESTPNNFPAATFWKVPASLNSSIPPVAVTDSTITKTTRDVPSSQAWKPTYVKSDGTGTTKSAGTAVRTPNSREGRNFTTTSADLPITAQSILDAAKPIPSSSKPKRSSRPIRNEFVSRVIEAPVPPLSTYEHKVTATSTSFLPVRPTASTDSTPSPEIATLAHSLDRVLFNPGVHWVRDPRSGVYNFSPSLEKLPKVDEFDFSKLPEYITSSRDEILGDLARREEVSFVSSTSSTTGMLSQVSCFHRSLSDLD